MIYQRPGTGVLACEFARVMRNVVVFAQAPVEVVSVTYVTLVCVGAEQDIDVVFPRFDAQTPRVGLEPTT